MAFSMRLLAADGFRQNVMMDKVSEQSRGMMQRQFLAVATLVR